MSPLVLRDSSLIGTSAQHIAAGQPNKAFGQGQPFAAGEVLGQPRPD